MMLLFRFVVLVSFPLVFATPAGASAVTYGYLGNDFVSVLDQEPPSGSYTTAMSINGAFSVAAPLGPGLVWSEISALVLDLEFTDGRTVFTDPGSIAEFYVSTDGTGAIVEWGLHITEGGAPWGVGDQEREIRTWNAGSIVVDSAALAECAVFWSGGCSIVAFDRARVEHHAGHWTLVPEPSTALLLTSGVAGLAARRRRPNSGRCLPVACSGDRPRASGFAGALR